MENNTSQEYQKAIEYIYGMIKDGRLIVGSRLPSERDLAQQIGIGRNSTREAISILRGWGIIESIHGSGNYISKESGTAIQMIVNMMLALGTTSKAEILQFRRAIAYTVCTFLMERGITAKEQKKFIDILDKMKRASNEEFAELDKEFHRKLIDTTDNMLFKTIMAPVGETYLELVPEVSAHTDANDREELIEIHTSLINGLANKDREACLSYLQRHYDFVEQKIL